MAINKLEFNVLSAINLWGTICFERKLMEGTLLPLQ